MVERAGPQVYSIAAHRGFADALVAGLVPRYRERDFGLARLTLLLPSRRAVRTLTEAFVRASASEGGGGLLLPRMAVVGDLDLAEALGALLDPLTAAEAVPPAADPLRRWLRLAAHLRAERGDGLPDAALLRQAHDLGRTIDRLLVEGIEPASLLDAEVIGIIGEQAQHWHQSTTTFLKVQARWQAERESRGELDPPARRNLLFARMAAQWRHQPPPHPVVAAGVTSASPALAQLLRVVAELPRGAVILPDLDLTLGRDVWDALGLAGVPENVGGPAIGAGDAVTHPQYHLKLLLNRMGVARSEVQAWHRSGEAASEPARSRAIANLFLPPAASTRWIDLPEDRRRLAGVRLMETAHPGEQAMAVAILIREALETPEKRVAMITPDRGIAARVVAHLRRWNIQADDSAGVPLDRTAAGRVLLLLAEVVAQEAAPVSVLALLGHPLVRAGTGRAIWLERVRTLDLALRGPRPAPGFASIGARLGDDSGLVEWWAGIVASFAPLHELSERADLYAWLDALAAVGEGLCGDGLWAGADGRALSQFVDDLRLAARETAISLPRDQLATVLRDAAARVAVRPPWGGHPRVAIYGLIEARMSRADLVICAGLHEGGWPAAPAPEPLLPPAVLRRLGIPGGDFRIGLAAHDLAGALGAPEVVLSWSRRDEAGPVIPSRFVLRVQALMGSALAARHREERAVELARAIDDAPRAGRYPRPQPMPAAAQRKVEISATGLDRLRGDPYQFYASKILALPALEGLDQEPSAAWKGQAAHAILDAWHKAGAPPGQIRAFAEAELDQLSAHPLTRSLWRPRLMDALDWIAGQIAEQRGEGRIVLATEAWGSIEVDGVRVHGRADRIDRLGDGTLGIVDYKTGSPPTARMVERGFALQLGLLGLIAARGGFANIAGVPRAFEYWSLARDTARDGFGFVKSPVRTPRMQSGPSLDDILPETARFLDEAITKWIIGDTPFTARLNPDLGGYNDYDQLMRLDEWIFDLGREDLPE